MWPNVRIAIRLIGGTERGSRPAGRLQPPLRPASKLAAFARLIRSLLGLAKQPLTDIAYPLYFVGEMEGHLL